MFVLHPVDNRSASGELVLLCWVFKGVVHTGDVVTHALEVTELNFGQDPRTDKMTRLRQCEREFSVRMTVADIQKHRKLSELSKGYSGAVFFDPDNWDAREIVKVMRQARLERKLQENASLENPAISRVIYLFDSQSSASEYTRELLRE
jgi:hypothetical protein